MAVPGTITHREKQVLCLVGQCKDNREMARALGCAESTVKTHLERLRYKLAIHKRVKLVRFALRNRIRPPECRHCKPSHCPLRANP